MTRYATSTREARELVAELSFVWDQIKHQSPQQSSFSDEEVPLRSRLKSAASRGERLTELEPRSQDSRDWEGAVFSDGDGGSDTTNNRRFKRYVNRTIEALKADIADLREEIDTFRVRSSHPSRRNGIITAIGKWIVRFIGVVSVCRGAENSFFSDMHCLTCSWRFWYGLICIVAATIEQKYGHECSRIGSDDD